MKTWAEYGAELKQKSLSRAAKKNGSASEAIGDKALFRIADPEKGTGEPGFEVSAELISVLPGVSIWLDESAQAEPGPMEEFLDLAESIAIPRAFSLLGGVPGIEGDSSLTILLSPKLNSGGLAVGFFNPCDFFPYSDEPESPLFNPTSNGRKIIYLGCPEAEAASPAYSPRSLCATICHEYQHLSRFYRKTYARILAGYPDPPVEDPAFDEAMSHFTESLCGFGASGGNLKFVERYLASPSAYSLRMADADGRHDSVGKRGGGALFMDYLFRLSGGAEWAVEKPLELVDHGGAAFIARSQEAEEGGWEFISGYFGKEAASLFNDCFSEMNVPPSLRAERPWTVDALSGEPLGIDAYMGALTCGAWTVNLCGPARADWGGQVTLSPWTASFGASFSLPSTSRISLSLASSGAEGLVIAGYLAR